MERTQLVKSRGRKLCDMVINMNNTEDPAESYSEKTVEDHNISLTQIELDSFCSARVDNITGMISFFHFILIFMQFYNHNNLNCCIDYLQQLTSLRRYQISVV